MRTAAAAEHQIHPTDPDTMRTIHPLHLLLAIPLLMALFRVPAVHGQALAEAPPPRIHFTQGDVLTTVEKTFPNLVESQGLRKTLEQALRDSAMRGNLTGRVAENFFERANGPAGFRPVQNPLAPQNDFYNPVLREGAQLKVHADPRSYPASMRQDHLAERFVVPDDQVADLQRFWRDAAGKARAKGDLAALAEAERQLGRIKPLGRTSVWLAERLETTAAGSATRAVAGGARSLLLPRVLTPALATGGVLLFGGAEAAYALYRHSQGEISSSELNDSLAHAGAQTGAGAGVVAGFAVLAPEAPFLVVAAVAVGTGYAVGWAVDAAISDNAPSESLRAITDATPTLIDFDHIEADYRTRQAAGEDSSAPPSVHRFHPPPIAP